MTLVNIHLIQAGKVTFCEAEIMYGIQQVGLAYAVSSANTYDPFRKSKFLPEIVFELI
jgi:hypothetical protein